MGRASVVDLLAGRWTDTAIGPLVAAWIAGWWFLRAATQFALGRRRGDWWIVGWFAALGALHVAAALR